MSKHKIVLDRKTGKPKAPAPRMAAGQRKNLEGKAASLTKRWLSKARGKI